MTRNMSDVCQEIVERYLDGDDDAINELVTNIEGMIKSIIKKYHHGEEFEDLYQVGWIAIMKCLQLYDKNTGTKFTSYAYRAIQNEIIQYINNQNKHKSKYDEDGNCLKGFIPMDSQVSNKQYEGSYMTVGDTIPDTSQDVERESILQVSIPVIHEILETFTNDNQHQMLIWYLEGRQQKWISEELNVTAAYVSNTIRIFNERCQQKLNKA